MERMENHRIEFKSRLSDGLEKEVVAFLNYPRFFNQYRVTELHRLPHVRRK
jgi:hypothetical protein